MDDKSIVCAFQDGKTPFAAAGLSMCTNIYILNGARMAGWGFLDLLLRTLHVDLEKSEMETG
jgi:hypothetical protein